MTPYRTTHSFSGSRPGLFLTGSVKALIIANVAFFILIHIGRLTGFPLISFFGLVPAFIWKKFMLWQFVTYMFVHVGLLHLVFNMLMFAFLGPLLEEIWGNKRFLAFCFFAGIGAGLCAFAFSFGTMKTTVGFSGVIFGLLVAHAVLFPESIILLFFLFPMKMKHAVWFFAGINILGMLSSPEAGISYIAHLGGGFFGFLFLKNEQISYYLTKLFDPPELSQKWKRSQKAKDDRRRAALEEQVDVLLDKISRKGIHSLTKKEKEILDKRSRLNKNK